LAGFPNKPRGVGQCPHGNRSVIGGHTAELVTSYERGLCTQICRAERSDYTRRPGADHQHVKHFTILSPPKYVMKLSKPAQRNLVIRMLRCVVLDFRPIQGRKHYCADSQARALARSAGEKYSIAALRNPFARKA